MTRTKRISIAITLVLVTIAGFLILRSYIFDQIQIKVRDAIQSLNDTGLSVKYDSIQVYWDKNQLNIKGLSVIKTKYDSGCIPESLRAKVIEIHGINLLKLVIGRKFSIDEIKVDSLEVVMLEGQKLFQDSSTRDNPFFFRAKEISLLHTKITHIDTLCQIVSNAQVNIHLTELNLEESETKSLAFSLEAFKLSANKVHLPKQNYSITIAEVRGNLSKGIMAIDTIKIIPDFGELAFGQKAGHDVDRIEGTIPFLNLSGIKYQYADTFSIRAKKIDLQFYLKLFHDKRLPHREIYKPLPIQQLRRLGFGLQIDTLEIKKSYVRYDEIAEGADTPGVIFFDNITGNIFNVNNDSYLQEGTTTLIARADLMGSGEIKLQSSFPYKDTENCRIEGSVTRFPFEKINSMLSPSTNLTFEAGQLNFLNFAFEYNDTRSDGRLKLNYQDLKILSLKEDKNVTNAERRKRKRNNVPEDLKKDNLKTFIINNFILNTNIDGRLPEEKGGTIMFYRDKTRSTFNYWWKSLFTGLKSALNLEKKDTK